MAILVTGGTGYIGSHTVIELLNNGEEIVIVDNLVNSKKTNLDRIKKITNKMPKFYKVDILNEKELEKVFKENKIDKVIHFAGLKAVGESVKKPLLYYQNNVTGTITLLKVMEKYNCKNIVFSSSATVYGTKTIECKEEMGRGETTNPYGTAKAIVEKILEDIYKSDNTWNIAILRYFNPIGAHESGLIGEEPNGIPNNLMPYIQKVAAKELPELSVFGNDYDTIDGTGVRDYIHVVDLAKGHVKAIEKLNNSNGGIYTYNLGTGNGYSVLQIIKAFEKVNGIQIPYKIVERRPGDLAKYYANVSKAREELGWVATKNIEDMCKDTWRYVQNELNGKDKNA